MSELLGMKSITNETMSKYPSVKNRMVMARQGGLGIIVGGAVTSVPWLVSKLDNEALWPVNLLDAPGLLASFALSGNVHNFSITFALVVNVLFYASLTYLFLRTRGKKV
jgi:hypothetical protein